MTEPPRRVMVVDDEDGIRALLRPVFEKGGWAVETCPDAQSAMELLGREQFDLLIVDKNLPDRSGIELLRAARERGIETPALLITGNPTARLAGDLLALHVEGFLRKPFTEVAAALRAANEIVERAEKGRSRQRGR